MTAAGLSDGTTGEGRPTTTPRSLRSAGTRPTDARAGVGASGRSRLPLPTDPPGTAMANGTPREPRLSIGAVLTRLQADFTDVTLSKIRYWETEGLVTPHRKPSGYREYSERDVERLRFVMSAQRDRYLPLKVIREELAALDRGEEPELPAPRLPMSAVLATEGPAPDDFVTPRSTPSRVDRSELLTTSGLDATTLAELEHFGLVKAGPGGWFDADAVVAARIAAELIAVGLEARHLRSFRTSADREVTLITQLVSAQARQRDPDARERAETEAHRLAATVLRLHALLVKSGLARDLGP